MDAADIARLLQAHLKRVGCDPGSTSDGAWSDASQEALDNFNKYAGTKFDVKIASLDALEAVRAKSDRICPLICGKGQRAAGDHCVQIVCETNFVLDAEGVCRKRPDSTARSKAVSRREPSPRVHARPAAGGDSCAGSCDGD
jgi:hypothetical protein